jgi:Peptidase family M50
MDVITTLALTTAGWTVLIGLTVVSALIHEAGHAVAWSLIGAEVREVGYANPGGPALRFKLGSLTFAFNPFAVYAYTLVACPGEQLRSLTRVQRIFVHGAGIMANLLAAALVLMVGGALIHLFAAFSASLAVQNAFFRDGRKIFAVLSEL